MLHRKPRSTTKRKKVVHRRKRVSAALHGWSAHPAHAHHVLKAVRQENVVDHRAGLQFRIKETLIKSWIPNASPTMLFAGMTRVGVMARSAKTTHSCHSRESGNPGWDLF